MSTVKKKHFSYFSFRRVFTSVPNIRFLFRKKVVLQVVHESVLRLKTFMWCSVSIKLFACQTELCFAPTEMRDIRNKTIIGIPKRSTGLSNLGSRQLGVVLSITRIHVCSHDHNQAK